MAYATAPANTMDDNPITPWWVALLSGISLLIIGILLLTRPALTALVLVRFMGWYWFFTGILSLVMIFRDRQAWGWKLFMGIVGIIAGLWIVKNPIEGTVAALVAIVIVLGVQALMFGIAALAASFQGGGVGAGILGVVSIILGISLLFNNVLLTSMAVPWVYGVLAVAGGIAEIVGSFWQRSHNKALAH